MHPDDIELQQQSGSDLYEYLYIALSGLFALVVTFAFFKSMGGKSSKTEDKTKITANALRQANLLEVQKEGDQLVTDYALRLIQFISEKTNVVTKVEREMIIKERRKLYQEGKNWGAYDSFVLQAEDLKDRTSQQLMTEVFEIIDIKESLFHATLQKIQADPTLQQYLLAATKGKSHQTQVLSKPTMSKEQLIEVIKFDQEASFIAMKKTLEKTDLANEDPAKLQLEVQINEAKLSDGMWIAHQIEREKYEENLMYFIQRGDPVVMKMMQEYVQKQMKMSQDAQAKKQAKAK